MNDTYEMLKGYIPVKSALKTRNEGDMLIIANRNSEIYYLNGTAREIWEMIDGKSTIDSLSRRILSEYDASPDEVNHDIVEFVRDMQWKRLLRLKEALS